ncbi:MAG TPA: M56 family metallopeptidase [Allosphingosinicella sp.]
MSGSLAVAGELLVRSTLLIVLACLAAAALRRSGASAAMRHLAWLCGIAALLTMPLLGLAVPALELPILSEVAPPRPTAVEEALASSAPASAEAPVAGEADGWASTLILAYAAVATMLLLRLATGWWTLGRLWRSANAAEGEWNRLLRDAARDLGLRSQVSLRLTRGGTMPMTWGTRAPRVLLPAEAAVWPDEQKRLVLLHELAHVGRRDSLSSTAASLACAVYWFHPGAWFAARQLRLEQEHAADDLALGAGTHPRSYARNLLSLAGRLGLPAPAMARTSQLERRILAIVGGSNRHRPGTGFAAAAAAVALLATWFLGTAVPVHAVADSPAPPVLATAASPAAANYGDGESAPSPAAGRPFRRGATASTLARQPTSLRTGDGAAPLPQLEAGEQQAQAGARQASLMEAQLAQQERQARAAGDEFMAPHLAAQREAYARQREAYRHQIEVIAQQREILAERGQILARQRRGAASRRAAARHGESVPALESLPAVPALPSIPSIPSLPSRPSAPAAVQPTPALPAVPSQPAAPASQSP